MDWKLLQPHSDKGTRAQAYWPHLMTGTPERWKIDKYLDMRLDSKGEPILSYFEPAIQHEDGWLEYKFSAFNEEMLPEVSRGPHIWREGARPEWESMWHGAKWEAVYSIVADYQVPGWGGLAASDDRDAGHRYNQDAKGVYMHSQTKKRKCENYTRYAPVFNDGTYLIAVFELVVDRN